MTELSNFISTEKLPVILVMVALNAILLFYLIKSRMGFRFYMRSILALDALEDSIGMASETGRPIFYVPGFIDIENPQTMASLELLSVVSNVAESYNSECIMLTGQPFTFLVSERNGIKSEFISNDSLACASGINGLIDEKKPELILYFGSFYAESLLMAEKGFHSGALQIAATASISEIPFFLASTDYCMIGEDLFAAKAYITGNKIDRASIKAIDITKIMIIVVIFVVSIIYTFLDSQLVKRFLDVE